MTHRESFTAVQLRELGTAAKTHYEELGIERGETLEKSTLGHVNWCFGQGKGHRVRIVRSDVSHGASICSAHHPIPILLWGKDQSHRARPEFFERLRLLASG